MRGVTYRTPTDVHYLMMRDTLAKGGGAYARDAFREKKLPNRYVVALGAPYSRVVPASLGAGAAPAIVRALRELADATEAWTSECALDTWVSEGKVYVDIVESYANLDHAFEVASERGELAIWDQEESREIPVPKAPAVPPAATVGNDPWLGQ